MQLIKKLKKNLCVIFLFIGSCQTTNAQIETVEIFLTNLIDDKHLTAYSKLDVSVQNQLSVNLFSETWQKIENSFGEFISFIKLCSSTPEESFFYKLNFATTSHIFKFTTGKERKILSFVIVANYDCGYKLPPYDKEKIYSEQKIELKENPNVNFTLSLPLKDTVKGVCIILQGSGLTDRDGSLGPNKILKDLSIGLSINRYANIRFDKPIPRSKEEMSNFTIENEYLSPLFSVINYARTKFPYQKLFLIGHSLGGIIAQNIAAKDTSFAGIILMSTNFSSLEETILHQHKYLFKNKIISKNQLDTIEKQVKFIKDSLFKSEDSNKKTLLNLPLNYWRSLNNISPVKQEINKTSFKTPFLVLYGGKDYHIKKEDFMKWKSSLNKSNQLNTTIIYPQLNHFLLNSNHYYSTPSEYNIPSNLPQVLIEDIVNWLNLTTD